MPERDRQNIIEMSVNNPTPERRCGGCKDWSHYRPLIKWVNYPMQAVWPCGFCLEPENATPALKSQAPNLPAGAPVPKVPPIKGEGDGCEFWKVRGC